jgi:hypothetical protein
MVSAMAMAALCVSVCGVRKEASVALDSHFALIQLPSHFVSHRTTTRPRVARGEAVEILDAKPAGCVRHFWVTLTQRDESLGKHMLLRITADGTPAPQVEMSLDHFFGMMLGYVPYRVEAAPSEILPKNGCNCYLPIPFAETCKIEPINRSDRAVTLWSMVNWQEYRDTAQVQEHAIDIGDESDAPYIGEGLYGREGPNPKSRGQFFRQHSFRWASNDFVLKDIPVFPNVANVLHIRTRAQGRVELSVGSWKTLLPGVGDYTWDYTFVIPKAAIGASTRVTIRATALDRVTPGATDKRTLFAAIDSVRVRRLEPGETVEEFPGRPHMGKEPDLPLQDRVRGVEARPVKSVIETYVAVLQQQLCNVATIGPMNGHGFANYASKSVPPSPGMDPEWIPGVTQACHDRGIAVIAWLPFNIQDVRQAADYQPAKRFPQWTMKYIADPARPTRPQVAMCIVSSPYREEHARELAEAVSFGVDGVFFDGFFLEGRPGRPQPGCVCEYCRGKFKEETGLDLPTQINWGDATFKRWVRWRNHALVETARYFRDEMRKANAGLSLTCNYNAWPFGTKDWETAVPLWRTSEYGVSQHAYAPQPHMEWLMLGFKSRLSHDLNPAHSDIWRTSGPTWDYQGTPEDVARHEINMKTFMLSGLAHGTTPWHGGHIQPPEVGRRIHEAMKAREQYFSHDSVRHLGVVLSQNTHDFYGHIPDTGNLADYRDAILGTWLLLTKRHLPFNFVFDNELEAGELQPYRVLLLANTAALSDAMLAKLRKWVVGGGHLIATADTALYDEWGERRAEWGLGEMLGVRKTEKLQVAHTAEHGAGRVTYIPGEPGVAYARERDERQVDSLLKAIRSVPFPFETEAPEWLEVTPMWGPERKSIYLHMLNVSAFMPGGDTGFRGVARPSAHRDDAGAVRRVSVPIENVVIRPRAWQVASARLGVGGNELKPDTTGAYIVPLVTDHEVLILDLQ